MLGVRALKAFRGSLEHIIYAAHYDNNKIEGNPRRSWVKVGLISDLSVLTNQRVTTATASLKTIWTDYWQTMPNERASTDQIILAIDKVRDQIKQTIDGLH